VSSFLAYSKVHLQQQASAQAHSGYLLPHPAEYKIFSKTEWNHSKSLLSILEIQSAKIQQILKRDKRANKSTPAPFENPAQQMLADNFFARKCILTLLQFVNNWRVSRAIRSC
jgi:hypothetical protein